MPLSATHTWISIWQDHALEQLPPVQLFPCAVVERLAAANRLEMPTAVLSAGRSGPVPCCHGRAASVAPSVTGQRTHRCARAHPCAGQCQHACQSRIAGGIGQSNLLIHAQPGQLRRFSISLLRHHANRMARHQTALMAQARRHTELMRLSAEFAPLSHPLPASPAASQASTASSPGSAGGAAAFGKDRHQEAQPGAQPALDMQPHASAPPAAVVTYPVCEADTGGGSAASPPCRVPGTPPQRPAQLGRVAHALVQSDDGAAAGDLSGATADSGSLSASGSPPAAPGGSEPAAAGGAAHGSTQAAATAAARGSVDPAALQPPPEAVSAFDTALARQLAAPAAAPCLAPPPPPLLEHTLRTSSGRNAATSGMAQSSGGSISNAAFTARLPSEPVVRSFRQAGSAPVSAAPSNARALHQSSSKSAALPGAPAPAAALSPALPAIPRPQHPPQLTTLGGNSEPAAPPAADDAGAGANAAAATRTVPQERLQALAQQPLSPPPWMQPDALTPTGNTAQVR